MKIIQKSEFCFGCKACVSACKDVNNLPAGVVLLDIDEKENCINGKVIVNYKAHNCLQCEKPLCMQACDFGAIRRDESGIVHIDSTLCKGCGKCQKACINNSIVRVGNHMIKCELCSNNKNNSPACVEACPMKCLEVKNNESQIKTLVY